MTITRTLKTIFAASAAFLTLASPALAHEGALGDGGPFRIEMLTEDPTGVETRWGNGEVEFHVEPGTEVVVIGLENEPMVKVDAEGNMFFNEKSPSWWTNQPEGTIPEGADSKADPNWVWKMAGGSMQFHDHRFHYMNSSIDPATADGSVVFEFGLPVLVNGAPVEMRGTMVFDSTLDPAAAEQLMTDNTMVDSTAQMETPSEDSGSMTLKLAAAAAAVVAIAAFVVVWRKR